MEGSNQFVTTLMGVSSQPTTRLFVVVLRILFKYMHGWAVTLMYAPSCVNIHTK
jgi:hypothetical protein